MKKYKDILIGTKSSIKEALKVIDTGAMRIALVVDENMKLLGTLSDGDIRRGLLNNLSLDDSIENLYFKNPTTAFEGDSKDKIIQKAILNQVYQIPIIDKDGILVDIITLVTLLNIAKKRNRVILMAGGLGTRLRPLTQDIPKPLLKVGNKPILETIIKNFASHGFVNITISLNYKGEMIKEYFKDGSEFGVNIDYIEEDMRLGTAGALSLLTDLPKEPFFVMNADLLTDVNFSHFLDFHSHSNAYVSMCVREYEHQIPYGVVETNNENITSIIEKPIQKFFVNAGIYLLSPNALDHIPKNEFYDMPTLFNTFIEKEKKVISFPIHEYWLDIGRLEEYKKANEEYENIF